MVQQHLQPQHSRKQLLALGVGVSWTTTGCSWAYAGCCEYAGCEYAGCEYGCEYGCECGCDMNKWCDGGLDPADAGHVGKKRTGVLRAARTRETAVFEGKSIAR